MYIKKHLISPQTTNIMAALKADGFQSFIQTGLDASQA